MNPGISVSRVGGDAQVKFMSNLGGIKLRLLSIRARSFSRSSHRISMKRPDDTEHGEQWRTYEASDAPMTVAEMGVVLFAANEGFLADVPVNKVLDFEALY